MHHSVPPSWYAWRPMHLSVEPPRISHKVTEKRSLSKKSDRIGIVRFRTTHQFVDSERLRMDIQYIREFVTLMSYDSFTSAAKGMFMSQPTLSRHIASLEKEVGQQLLFDTHPLKPTKAGEAVMRYATDILSTYDAMSNHLASLAKHKPELIRIQNLMHFEAMYTGVLEAAARTEEAFPSVSFDFGTNVLSAPIEEILQNKDADIVFQFSLSDKPYHSAQIDENLYETINIASFTGEMGFGIRKDSPLLSKKQLHLSDFANERFLIIAKRSADSFAKNFSDICAKEGFMPRIETVAKSDALDFYSQGPGEGVLFITCMTEDRHTTFDRYIAENMTVIKPVSKYGPYYVSATLIARKTGASPAFRYFLDQVRSIENSRRAHDVEASSCPSRD